jgi:DNA-directed RNA polymerase subunit L
MISQIQTDMESSISLPSILNATEEHGTLTFQMEKTNMSIINALRRTLLTDIPCFVFRTFPDSENQTTIHKNTCRFHNEILKQRLGCIPINIKDLETPVENLRVIIKVQNDTDSIRYVTTRDFQIKDIVSGKFISSTEIDKIFPPSPPPAQGYILFTRLRPRLSANIPGEEIDIESKISISTAKESGMYNMCSTVTYFMSTDPVQQNAQWAILRDKSETDGTSAADIEKERKNWYAHDAKRFVKKNTYDFILETIGVYSNVELIHTACDVLISKFTQLRETATQRGLEIIRSKNTLPNCFDMILKDEDYTIGKVIEYIIHEDYFQNNKQLHYVGFIKEHPHDEDSIIRISFLKEVSEKEAINSIIEYVTQVAIKIFTHIKDF